MIKRIDFSTSFDKQLRKAPFSIKRAFRKRLELFVRDQDHPLLRHHQHKGTLQNYYSINITGDWRALYSFKTENSKKLIFFEMLGTHSQLYR